MRAQQALPVVGLLHYASPPDTFAHIAEAVRRGLKEAGHVEGQNVSIDYRWAYGHYDRLLALAADLVYPARLSADRHALSKFLTLCSDFPFFCNCAEAARDASSRPFPTGPRARLATRPRGDRMNSDPIAQRRRPARRAEFRDLARHLLDLCRHRSAMLRRQRVAFLLKLSQARMQLAVLASRRVIVLAPEREQIEPFRLGEIGKPDALHLSERDLIVGRYVRFLCAKLVRNRIHLGEQVRRRLWR